MCESRVTKHGWTTTTAAARVRSPPPPPSRKTTYTAGYCCSIFALMDDAISCSVANAAMASCAAMIANSCIAPGMVLALTTGLAVVDMIALNQRRRP